MTSHSDVHIQVNVYPSLSILNKTSVLVWNMGEVFHVMFRDLVSVSIEEMKNGVT